MRRAVIAVLLSVLVLTAGCSRIVPEEKASLRLYASFYPLYATAAIVAEGVSDTEIYCLTAPQAGCLRAYSISDWDVELVSAAADGVLLFGSGMESFTDTLKGCGNVWIAELLQPEALIEIPNTEAAELEDDHFSGAIPFSYLSTDGSASIVEQLCGVLSVVDPEHADRYRMNADRAIEQLGALRDELAALTESCRGVRVALLNEALIYPATEFGMECVACIRRESGVSLYDTELEKTLETLRAARTQVVLIERQAPVELKTALTDAGFRVAELDTMSLYPVSAGTEPYMDALKQNAQAAAAACAEIDRTEGEP